MRRLCVFDADSTLTTTEGIDLLAEIAGAGHEVAQITASAMRGELDFEDSLRRRVALLAGLPLSAVDLATSRATLTPGAAECCSQLRAQGWTLGVVSGGFTLMVEPLARELELDHVRANVLEVSDGVLTGGVVGPVIDRAAKAEALRQWAAMDGVELTATVAVGDGANDIDMLQLAGHGVAFGAKGALRAVADTCIDSGDLRDVAAQIANVTEK